MMIVFLIELRIHLKRFVFLTEMKSRWKRIVLLMVYYKTGMLEPLCL